MHLTGKKQHHGVVTNAKTKCTAISCSGGSRTWKKCSLCNGTGTRSVKCSGSPAMSMTQVTHSGCTSSPAGARTKTTRTCSGCRYSSSSYSNCDKCGKGGTNSSNNWDHTKSVSCSTGSYSYSNCSHGYGYGSSHYYCNKSGHGSYKGSSSTHD